MNDGIDPFEFGGGSQTPRIVGLSMRQVGPIENFLAGDHELKRGDRVLVDSDAGLRLATVEVEPQEANPTLNVSTLKSIKRPATENDFRIEADNLTRETYARRLTVEKILERDVPMKLVNVEYSFDARKATFYFTAEDRIDFRTLVRDLANILNVRIEMKQIRARDETKVTGALGPCGRELCCSSWLRDFETVTVKMAREQGLALNPSRLAGMCGRLKCCLRYEYATYVELKRNLPAIGKLVQSVKGDGRVLRQNILKQTVTIQLDGEGGQVDAAMEDLVDKRAQ
ncbi:MAG: stage 0 sporulation protein [Candidatus Binataceae bacterium]|nr:stage 0 sporulation protein [Candidatus Binataceae bacterium]